MSDATCPKCGNQRPAPNECPACTPEPTAPERPLFGSTPESLGCTCDPPPRPWMYMGEHHGEGCDLRGNVTEPTAPQPLDLDALRRQEALDRVQSMASGMWRGINRSADEGAEVAERAEDATCMEIVLALARKAGEVDAENRKLKDALIGKVHVKRDADTIAALRSRIEELEGDRDHMWQRYCDGQPGLTRPQHWVGYLTALILLVEEADPEPDWLDAAHEELDKHIIAARRVLEGEG